MASHQQSNVAHFDSAAAAWRDVYGEQSVYGAIYRDRMAAAIGWIEDLTWPVTARALDIGCGAGLITAALARKGFNVEAIDTSSAMVESTIARVAAEQLSSTVSVHAGNIHALAYEDASFDVVVCLGVIPWINDSAAALKEVARVLKPGGSAIVSADNRARLSFLLEPWANPFLRPVRRGRDYVRGGSSSSTSIAVRFHWPHTIDRYVRAVGLESMDQKGVGFGPFTLKGHPLLTEEMGRRLHRRLQSLSDRKVAGLHRTGSHYLVLARKPMAVGPRASSRNS